MNVPPNTPPPPSSPHGDPSEVSGVTPSVTATAAGTIALELSPGQAEVLTKILCHYPIVIGGHAGGQVETVDGFDAATWEAVVVQLLTARHVSKVMPDAVLVPFHATRRGEGAQ